jgi:hypothetical protein
MLRVDIALNNRYRKRRRVNIQVSSVLMLTWGRPLPYLRQCDECTEFSPMGLPRGDAVDARKPISERNEAAKLVAKL